MNEIAEAAEVPLGQILGWRGIEETLEPMEAQKLLGYLGIEDPVVLNDILLETLKPTDIKKAIDTLTEIISKADNHLDEIDIVNKLRSIREKLTVYRFYEDDLPKYLKKEFGAVLKTDDFGNEVWEMVVKPEYNKIPDGAFGLAAAGVTFAAGFGVANSDEGGEAWLPLLGVGGIIMGKNAKSFKFMKASGKTFIGPDGLERFEISDYLAKFTKNGESILEKKGSLRADEVFEFIFFEADINRPHGGLMFQQPLLATTAFNLPELEEES